MNTTVHEIFIFGAKVVSFLNAEGLRKKLVAVNVFRNGVNLLQKKTKCCVAIKR